MHEACLNLLSLCSVNRLVKPGSSNQADRPRLLPFLSLQRALSLAHADWPAPSRSVACAHSGFRQEVVAELAQRSHFWLMGLWPGPLIPGALDPSPKSQNHFCVRVYRVRAIRSGLVARQAAGAWVFS